MNVMHCVASIQICVSQRINLYWMENNIQKGADSTEEIFQLNPCEFLSSGQYYSQTQKVIEPLNCVHLRLVKLTFEDLNGIMVSKTVEPNFKYHHLKIVMGMQLPS